MMLCCGKTWWLCAANAPGYVARLPDHTDGKLGDTTLLRPILGPHQMLLLVVMMASLSCCAPRNQGARSYQSLLISKAAVLLDAPDRAYARHIESMSYDILVSAKALVSHAISRGESSRLRATCNRLLANRKQVIITYSVDRQNGTRTETRVDLLPLLRTYSRACLSLLEHFAVLTDLQKRVKGLRVSVVNLGRNDKLAGCVALRFSNEGERVVRLWGVTAVSLWTGSGDSFTKAIPVRSERLWDWRIGLKAASSAFKKTGYVEITPGNSIILKSDLLRHLSTKSPVFVAVSFWEYPARQDAWSGLAILALKSAKPPSSTP